MSLIRESIDLYQGHRDQHFGPVTYSQHGEDLLLLNIFKQLGIENPTYLDVGAHHPETISNTKLLYNRGSRGYNIEANPNLIDEFIKKRPEDKNINIGISAEAGSDKLPFYMFSLTSGRNTFSKEEAEKFSSGNNFPIREVINLPVKTINQIVDEYCSGIFPDFLNMDLEGFDFKVLEALDFSKNSPKVVCVETRLDDSSDMVSMMKTKSFFPYCRMGENIIFIQNGLFGTIMKILGLL